jgi:hypothetical protein
MFNEKISEYDFIVLWPFASYSIILLKNITDDKAKILFRIGDMGTADTVNTLNPKFFVASLITTNVMFNKMFKRKLDITCKVMHLSCIGLHCLVEKCNSFLLEYIELY